MKKEYTKEMMCLTHKMKLFHARLRTNEELTDAEFVVLVTIAERSREKKSGKMMSASTSDVAKHMGATLPAASKMVRNLSIKGYVRQIPDELDRRVTQLALTEKGDTVLRESFQKRHVIMSRVFEQFGEEKTGQLIDLFVELADLMEKEVMNKDD